MRLACLDALAFRQAETLTTSANLALVGCSDSLGGSLDQLTAAPDVGAAELGIVYDLALHEPIVLHIDTQAAALCGRPLRAARLSRGTEAQTPVLVTARAHLPTTAIRLRH